MYRANHISAFLFIRAYHRAIANDMNIRDLAKKLDVDVKYIIHRRQYLSKLLGVTFPKLRSSAKELERKELLPDSGDRVVDELVKVLQKVGMEVPETWIRIRKRVRGKT